MTNFKVVFEEVIEQQIKKGLFTGKEFKTVAQQTVGQHFVIIQDKNGLGGSALGDTRELAINAAIEEYKTKHNK